MANEIKAKFKIGDIVKYTSRHDSYITNFVVDRIVIHPHQEEHRYSGIVLDLSGNKTGNKLYECAESHLDFSDKNDQLKSQENKMDINEYLKKIKVLSRAIYTEVMASAIKHDKGEAYCTKEVVDECIDAAVQFESSFTNFSDNAKRLTEGDKDAQK